MFGNLLNDESSLYFLRIKIINLTEGILKSKFMRSLLLTAVLTALLASMFACGDTGTGSGSGGDGAMSGSPTEAYKELYAAVKSKDTAKIKAAMSKNTQAFAEMVASRQNSPIEKVFENGFTATTFADSLPQIRDERIDGDYGAIEVRNAKDNKWEDLGFIREATVSFQVGGNAKAVAVEATKDMRSLKVTETGDGLQAEGVIPYSDATNLQSRLAEVGASIQIHDNGWKLAIGEMFGGTFKSPGVGRATKEQEAANLLSPNLVPVNAGNTNLNGNVKMIIPKERPQTNTK